MSAATEYAVELLKLLNEIGDKPRAEVALLLARSGVRGPIAPTREIAGELALQALTKLVSATPLGDGVYNVRENEGKGWDGPRVTAYSQGCGLIREALITAGIQVVAPFPRPSFGTSEDYYTFPDPATQETEADHDVR